MECDEAQRLLIGDLGRFTSRIVLLKQPYFMIPMSEEDSLGGMALESLLKRATNSCFMKISKFRHLLGKNYQSIEMRKVVSRSLVDAQSIELRVNRAFGRSI